MDQPLITWPLGKHKGKPVSELPQQYIAWALSTLKLSKRLREALEAVAAKPTMPFGLYKGELISDLPAEYCEWLLQNCEDLGEPLLTLLRQRTTT